MRKLSEMSSGECSLLLYFETRCVDYSAKVDTKMMNSDDMKIAKKWNKDGFVKFGRLPASEVILFGSNAYHCELSDDAWKLAHEERKARWKRNVKNSGGN